MCDGLDEAQGFRASFDGVVIDWRQEESLRGCERYPWRRFGYRLRMALHRLVWIRGTS